MMQQVLTYPQNPAALPVDDHLPLYAGDRLTRQEFERRYQAHPEIKKAELVEGIVYMASPVKYKRHGNPHLLLNTWAGTYLAFTPGVDGGDNVTLRLDDENEFDGWRLPFRA